MTLYQRNIGKTGEQKAEIFLKNNGYSIIKTNYLTKYGEIDIIAKKNKTIYFIEVKTRTSDNFGQPWEAININKILHLKKTANHFLLKYGYKEYKLKLSVISIILKDSDDELKFFDSIE